jgi:hypothetical protein
MVSKKKKVAPKPKPEHILTVADYEAPPVTTAPVTAEAKPVAVPNPPPAVAKTSKPSALDLRNNLINMLIDDAKSRGLGRGDWSTYMLAIRTVPAHLIKAWHRAFPPGS